MKKRIKWRLSLIIVTVLLSFVFFLPSTPFYAQLPSWWGKVFPSKGIVLGLDLQGGMHLVLKVEGEKGVENILDRVTDSLREVLTKKETEEEKKERVSVSSVERDGEKIIITLGGPEEGGRKETIRQVRQQHSILTILQKEGNQLVFGIKELERKRMMEIATSQALETIRNRIDQFGVTEPIIQRQGDQEILIQLPGVKDTQRAIDLIGKTALLEFKLIDDKSPVSRDLPQRLSAEEQANLLKDFAEKIPDGDEILFERITDNEENELIYKRPYLVKKNAVVTGDSLTDARVSIGDFNKRFVSITFDSTGATLFEKVTGEHRGERLAIVLDSTVYSAPVINERISGGMAQISGGFTMQEATDLAIVLRAGALPAPVKIIQNVTVGPTLGADSVKMGMRAALIGAVFVSLFMVSYYRVCGLIADFNLFLNVTLLIGAMASLNATLTLPGIAGIILAVGLSVDSNVLIFERIREEIRAGKPVRMAVESGYDKAFLTIIDSHVTTLITAFVLFIFGTGPIKGFAVSLSLGVIINLFTSLVGTKVIFDFVNGRWKIQRLSI